jgi:hypothetical protein
VAAVPGRAIGATLLAGLAVAGAYWVDGRRGAVVVAVLSVLAGIAWWYRARETTGDADGSGGDEEASPASRQAGDADADATATWTLRELWRQFARWVAPGRWRTRTPAEVARQAIRSGYPAEPVWTLATAFREVEYGNRSPSTVARDRLETIYDSLRGARSDGRSGDSSSTGATRDGTGVEGPAAARPVEDPTPEGDGS